MEGKRKRSDEEKKRGSESGLRHFVCRRIFQFYMLAEKGEKWDILGRKENGP